MPHNLATINGQVSMAYLGETPWHGLGTRLSAELAHNVDGALAAANLAWTVRTEPVMLADGRIVPTAQAIIRETDGGVILGHAGADYTVVQNTAAAGTLRVLVEELGATIETMGALGDGRECWALANLPGATVDATGNGDNVKGYFLARWGHGTISLTGDLTQIRVVCQNTMNLALSALAGAGKRARKPGNVYRVIHRSGAPLAISEAAALVGKLTEAAQANGHTFAELARRAMTPVEVAKYISDVFPMPVDANGRPLDSSTVKQRREDVAALVWAGKGAELAGATADGRATAWAAFNAVTEYFDHVRPAQASTDAARLSAQSSALFGTYQQVKQTAFDRARELVLA